MGTGNGSYSEEIGCRACHGGQYNDERGKEVCKGCILGRASSTKGAKASTACKECSKGYYADETGLLECKLCSRGRSSNIIGSNFSCQPCLEGTFENEEGQTVCKQCPKGQYGPLTDATKCVLCGYGQYSGEMGEKHCKQCIKGKSLNSRGSILESNCEDCLPGQYSQINGAENCTLCSVGFYNAQEGSSICLDCAPGLHATKKGSKECIKCPGDPPCLGRGTCSSKTGGCICSRYPPNGWEGKQCDICNTIWSNDNLQCNICSSGYEMIQGTCMKNCPTGLYHEGKKCVTSTAGVILVWIKWILTGSSILAFLYRMHVYIQLSRAGLLDPKIGFVKGFLAVFAYGKQGDHVLSTSSMRDRRESLLELGTRRDSLQSFYSLAKFNAVIKKRIDTYGVLSTSDLYDLDDGDLDAIGLRALDVKRFKAARSKLAGETGEERRRAPSAFDMYDILTDTIEEEISEEDTGTNMGLASLRNVLVELNLPQYEEALIAAGIKSATALSILDVEDLISECHVKKLHARALIKHAKDGLASLRNVLLGVNLLQYEEGLIAAGISSAKALAISNDDDLISECHVKKLHAKMLIKHANKELSSGSI